MEEQKDYLQPEKLSINHDIEVYLKEAAGWAKLIGIVAFVLTGIIVIVGLLMITGAGALSREFGSMGAFVGVIYIAAGAIYFFPGLYLYNFSKNMKVGLKQQAQWQVTTGFESLKSFFKFSGILTLILICIYGLMLLGFIVFGAASWL
jgi:hypothetical protein